MTMNPDLLDAQMGTPPPTTVDVDRVIVRQRRRLRLKHVGVASSAGVMALAIALVLTNLPHAGTGKPAGVGAAPTHSVRVTPTPASSRDQEVARLTQVLRQLLTADLPHAQFLPFPQGYDPSVVPLAFIDQGDYFSANAAIKDAAGRGSISVSVGREQDSFRLDHGCSQDPPPLDVKVQCETHAGPGGATIMVLQTTRGNYKRHVVEIYRKDGNSVMVDVSNGAAAPLKAQRATPPLTTDQVINLAVNPALGTTLP
jgi:hypothetical protein